MSQQNLTQALELLKTLEAQTSGETQQQIKQINLLVERAYAQGEGQEAEEVRNLLEETAKRQSEFTSHMVHEVRKPMTSMRGYSDMLVKNIMGPLNDMQMQAMTTIRNNVLSMEQLVTDISDISKLKAGRVKAEPKMEMFKNIAMQLEKDLTDFAQNRQIQLTFETPQGLPLLNLDSVRATQALRKLIENSIKYSHEGQGQVVVSARGEEGKLVVTVKDNGVGISPSDQARLGEIFFRGDQELVTQSKGYGLGLPIAMECLKLIGGELRWESSPGQGSTFEVTLPTMG